MWSKLPIVSITPFTFQDYPDRTACIIWFAGCNMACGYCHNPELVKGELRRLPAERIIEFLDSRRGRLEGVVLSGGECTLSPGLPQFARYLKDMGFCVKIDTNGTRPERLESMLVSGLVDFVALDFKAPRNKFEPVTKLAAWEAFERSLRIVCGYPVACEIRTTVHGDLIDRADLEAILATLEDVGYAGRWVIQNFRMGRTLGDLEPSRQSPQLMGLKTGKVQVQLRGFPCMSH